MRILPVLNDEINEEWISDKIRFSQYSFVHQRITVCYSRVGVLSAGSYPQNLSFCFKSFNWENMIYEIWDKNIFWNRTVFLIALGPFSDLELCLVLKNFLVKSFSKYPLVSSFSVFSSFLNYPCSDWRSDFFASSTLFSIFNEFDIFIFFGFNPKQMPILNIRFLQLSKLKTKFFSFGPAFDNFGYRVINLGTTWHNCFRIFEAKNDILKFLLTRKIFFVVSDIFYSFFSSFLPNSILNFLFLKFVCFKFLYLPVYSSTFNFLEVGITAPISVDQYTPFKKRRPAFFFPNILKKLLGAPVLPRFIKRKKVNFFNFSHDSAFIKNVPHTASATYYVSSHSTNRCFDSDYILPSLFPFEKVSTFLNFMKKTQSTSSIFVASSDARSDWNIFERLLGTHFVYYQNFLITRSNIKKFFKLEVGGLVNSETFDRSPFRIHKLFVNLLTRLPLSKSVFFNYYTSDYITRTSPLMLLRAKSMINFSFF